MSVPFCSVDKDFGMKLRSLDLRNFKVHRRKLNLVISISTKVGIFGIMRAKSACKVNQIRTKYIELIINLNEFKIIFALILLYLGPCRTIQNTSKCTDGSCTTTATDEMTCSSGVTINTSSTNNNTNGKKKSRYILMYKYMTLHWAKQYRYVHTCF